LEGTQDSLDTTGGLGRRVLAEASQPKTDGMKTAGPEFSREIQVLKKKLMSPTKDRVHLLAECMSLLRGYRVRRQRSGCTLALGLAEKLSEELNEAESKEVEDLRASLKGELDLWKMTESATQKACFELIRFIEERPEDSHEARLVLGRAWFLLASHFPRGCSEWDLAPEEGLVVAMGLAEESLEAVPTDASANTLMGRLILSHPDSDLGLAIEFFQRALGSDSEYDPAEVALAWVDIQKNSLKSAHGRLQRVLARENQSPGFYHVWSQYHLAVNQYDDAYVWIERAVRGAPQSGIYYLEKAVIAGRLGRKGEAESAFERAKELLGDTYFFKYQQGFS